MATWHYRKNGGEVEGISVKTDAWTETDYFGVAVNPSEPDGDSLDPQKIWDGTQIRNATAGEIAAFPGYASEDENLRNRDMAKDLVDIQPQMRKTLRCLIEVLIDEINILRAQHSLPDRTLTQAVTAIKDKIDSGDND